MGQKTLHEQFSSWQPLSDEAPAGPGALQARLAGGELLDYPEGQSAMVAYLVTDDLAEAARRLEEMAADDPRLAPEQALEARFLQSPRHRQTLIGLLGRFVKRFGTTPLLNPPLDAAATGR